MGQSFEDPEHPTELTGGDVYEHLSQFLAQLIRAAFRVGKERSNDRKNQEAKDVSRRSAGPFR
jgi:hypothetical protein